MANGSDRNWDTPPNVEGTIACIADWDPARGLHQGQQSIQRLHQQAEDKTASDPRQSIISSIAMREPSRQDIGRSCIMPEITVTTGLHMTKRLRRLISLGAAVIGLGTLGYYYYALLVLRAYVGMFTALHLGPVQQTETAWSRLLPFAGWLLLAGSIALYGGPEIRQRLRRS